VIPFCFENPLVARELQALIDEGRCPIILVVPGRDESDEGAGIYVGAGAPSEGTPREKALVVMRKMLERTLEDQFDCRRCGDPTTCPELKLVEAIRGYTMLTSRRYWLVVLQSDCDPSALHIWYNGNPITIPHFEALERVVRLLETLEAAEIGHGTQPDPMTATLMDVLGNQLAPVIAEAIGRYGICNTRDGYVRLIQHHLPPSGKRQATAEALADTLREQNHIHFSDDPFETPYDPATDGKITELVVGDDEQ
jgi:hypothetical protein